MKGTSHAIVGATAGLSVAVWLDTAPAATGLLILLGGFSALAPDLDTNGKLSNRMSLHRKWLWFALASIGVLLGTFSLITLDGIIRIIGTGVALTMIIVPRFVINQRFMVLLSGITITGLGWFWSETWIFLFGLFTIAATFLPHRGPTHSIIGLLFFSGIAYFLEQSISINGIFLSCIAGYLSHLILDMKCLPFNKKGVKWFQPVFNREF